MEHVIAGVAAFFTLTNIVAVNAGIFFGILIGALPGLSVLVGVVLFLPFTYEMTQISGILLLLGIYIGGTLGGSITAILVNTPGTPAAAATLLDGPALARKGMAKKALLTALYASCIAGFVSATVLLVAAPPISRIALEFGPPEFFALAVFGLSVIAAVSGESLWKSIVMGCLGLFISMVGIDPSSGVARFTFGRIPLMAGIGLIPPLIGMFAIVEVVERARLRSTGPPADTTRETGLTWREFRLTLRTIIKSSIIGTIVGAIPGTGAGIGSFVSHNEAKRSSKRGDEIGKGSLEGVAASEAGNNGVTGATLIPLLTLGIPGDAITAVLLGAFTIQGLIPGPDLFRDQAVIVYSVIVGLMVANIFMLLQGRFLMNLYARVTRIPTAVIVPVLLALSVAGTYATRNSAFDILLIAPFGILSYFLKSAGFTPIPMILGIVLGPIMEQNLRRSLVMSDMSAAIFLQRPIAAAFVALTVVSLIGSEVRRRRARSSESR